MKSRTIGDFEVVRELGRGGMGVVYEARQRGSQRRVAIKVLTAFDPEEAARFRQEALAAARVRHPNVVAVHDFGVDQGRPFLVMELIEGETLQARLARGPLSEAELLDLADALGAALEAAHAEGVLHRDLKPENVILAADGRAILTDFGLARVVSESRERLTRSGDMLGTPAFMAPEQAVGQLDAIGVSTDVYGLGATLYAAAVGRAPFSGLGGLIPTLNAVLTAPVSPPRRSRPELSARIEAVLLRSLAKEPSERFASIGELVAALHADAPAPQLARLSVLLAGVLLVACALSVFLARRSAPVAGDTATPTPGGSRPGASASPPQRRTPSPAVDRSQPAASLLASVDALDARFLPNGDLVTGGETLSRWSPPYTRAVAVSGVSQVCALAVMSGGDPRIFAVSRRSGAWHLLELSPRGEQLQEPLRLPSDSELPAALDLSPGGRWVALRANHAAEVWLGDLKDRRWVKLETRHVNAAVFSPSAPHQVLLLVGTSSLNFKNDDVVKSACELWDLDQVSAGCAARLLLPGRPNVAEPVEGGGWLIGLRTGEILQVDRDLVRVGPAWWPLERQAVGGGLGFEEGIPVSGLATPERNHLIVTSGHDDRPQACFSWHTRSARGWARSERFELPGRTLSIFSCQLSPDRSTLALVIRDGSESRCELWRLRRPR